MERIKNETMAFTRELRDLLELGTNRFIVTSITSNGLIMATDSVNVAVSNADLQFAEIVESLLEQLEMGNE